LETKWEKDGGISDKKRTNVHKYFTCVSRKRKVKRRKELAFNKKELGKAKGRKQIKFTLLEQRSRTIK